MHALLGLLLFVTITPWASAQPAQPNPSQDCGQATRALDGVRQELLGEIITRPLPTVGVLATVSGLSTFIDQELTQEQKTGLLLFGIGGAAYCNSNRDDCAEEAVRMLPLLSTYFESRQALASPECRSSDAAPPAAAGEPHPSRSHAVWQITMGEAPPDVGSSTPYRPDFEIGLERRALLGTWTGDYDCAPKVGVNVDIRTIDDDGTIHAMFSFYPLNIKYPWSLIPGSYSLVGRLDANSDVISLKADRWINQSEPGQLLNGFSARLIASETKMSRLEGQMDINGSCHGGEIALTDTVIRK